MSAFTVRYRPMPSMQQRSSLDEFARRNGATANWVDASAYGRSYALIEGAINNRWMTTGDAITVFDTPVIALAIRPNVAEALPALEDALGGPGRPKGMLAFESTAGAAIVEWNMDVTPARVVLALVDVELARFNAARVTELLTPLPLGWWTAVARDGLQAPEIAPDRVLEALIGETHAAP